ncbi:Glucose-repressible alcohol dehydrogenase transcriptional effector [Geranomyces michiganensis]|nr:Glucose-repressible alcohol dehydrogenase transcriptional effector [Geranomyces michiganensis]
MAITPPEVSRRKYPRIEIEYCPACRWLLRAAWVAQELLTTFEKEVGEVALQPGPSGTFTVRIVTTAPPPASEEEGTAAAAAAAASTTSTLLWDRKQEGGFPESMKDLKQRVRDVIARLAPAVLPTVRVRNTAYACELPCPQGPPLISLAGDDDDEAAAAVHFLPTQPFSLSFGPYDFPERRPYRKDSGFDDAVPDFATAVDSTRDAQTTGKEDLEHISIVVHGGGLSSSPAASHQAAPDTKVAKSDASSTRVSIHRHSTLSVDAEPYTPLGKGLCTTTTAPPPMSVMDAVKKSADSAVCVDHTPLLQQAEASAVRPVAIRRYDQAMLLSLRPMAADVRHTLRIPAPLRAMAAETMAVSKPPLSPRLLRGPDNCPLLALPPSFTSPTGSNTKNGSTSAAHIPLRQWMNAGAHLHRRSAEEFSVMTWNVLAPMYCTREKFPDLSDASREWGHRRAKVLDEVTFYASDVVCLQEVTLDDFENFFAPKLHTLGYAGVYREKARAPAPLLPSFSPANNNNRTTTTTRSPPTMPPGADGCALFYNTHNFALLDIDTFSYPELAARHLPATHDVSVDVLRFPNTGIHALFRHILTGNKVRVVTTHLHWNPANERTKLLQAALLMEYLTTMTIVPSSSLSSCSSSSSCGDDNDDNSVGGSKTGDVQRPSTGGRSRPRSGSHTTPAAVSQSQSLAGIPIVLAGDLNSMRGERVHQFLESGAADVSGDWGWVDKEYGAFSTTTTTTTTTANNSNTATLPAATVSHKAKLASAYGPKVLSFTNKTPTFAGTIDHVFYTPATLTVRDVLGPIVDGWLDKVPALPTASVVSDHLPLGVWMAWKGKSGNTDRGSTNDPHRGGGRQQLQKFAPAAGCGGGGGSAGGGAVATRVRNQKQKQHQQAGRSCTRERDKLNGRPQSWRAATAAPAANGLAGGAAARKDVNNVAAEGPYACAKKTRRRSSKASAASSNAGRRSPRPQ